MTGLQVAGNLSLPRPPPQFVVAAWLPCDNATIGGQCSQTLASLDTCICKIWTGESVWATEHDETIDGDWVHPHTFLPCDDECVFSDRNID